MRIPATIILLIVCSLFSSGLCRSLLHEQHATVSIKTKTGQVYNCVEFHKQPAFSNPSLELDVLSNIAEIQGKQKHTSFGLQGDGCPIGTVPILFISNDTKFGVIDAELEPPPPPEKHCLIGEEKWRCPEVGWWKVNSDGAILSSKGSGMGVVIRGSDGSVRRVVVSRGYRAMGTGLYGSQGGHFGTLNGSKMGLDYVILETDCLAISEFGNIGGHLAVHMCPINYTIRVWVNSGPEGVLDAAATDFIAHAVVRTRLNDPNKKFFGIGGEISLYKPELHNGRQWSSARMKIINGGESIEAGWMVNPTLFHDNEAHLFTRFIGAGKDCINTQCQGGFVQIDTQVALGIIPEAYSVIGGDQYTWTLSIDKDNNSGHWWLSLYTANKVKISVGYWPKEMFTSLLEFGSQIEWGGETDNPEQSTPRPHMGDGRLATYDSKVCAFVANALYVGRNGVHNDPEDTEKLQDCYSSYTVLDHGYRGSTWGRILYFGGPQSIL